MHRNARKRGYLGDQTNRGVKKDEGNNSGSDDKGDQGCDGADNQVNGDEQGDDEIDNKGGDEGTVSVEDDNEYADIYTVDPMDPVFHPFR